jgi:hypothetical protein
MRSLAGFSGGGRQAVSSWQRVRILGRPWRMRADGAMIVFRWGPHCPAAGVSVCPWGPATRSAHDDP